MRARHKTTMVAVLAVCALLVLAVMPAGAKKPDNSGKPEPEPHGGTMCSADEAPADLAYDENGDFTFSLSGKSDGACINVMTTQAGVWKVTIEGEGARYLGIIPRDSIAPGDSCGGPLLRSTIYDHGPDNPLSLGYDGTMPATTVNGCDYLNGREFAFEEWVAVDHPGFDPADCLAGTEVDGQCLVEDRLSDVAHPFALQVFMSGQGGKTTTFHVDLP